VSVPPAQIATCRNSGFKAVAVEGLTVALAGTVLAFAFNAASPSGLDLMRNYFPGAVRPAALAVAMTNRVVAGGGTNAPPLSAAELVAARLKAKDLQLVDRDQAWQLFQDPRYAHNLIVFVDARDDAHYQAGHIPGAHLFDHYRAPDYLAGVLAVCQTAERVVVYCNGGDCEDSEFAAVLLRDVGVPNAKLAVYAGGITEWQTNRLPVELGARLSGVLREKTK
jgi:rhodanese-related sulfurtransferase